MISIQNTYINNVLKTKTGSYDFVVCLLSPYWWSITKLFPLGTSVNIPLYHLFKWCTLNLMNKVITAGDFAILSSISRIETTQWGAGSWSHVFGNAASVRWLPGRSMARPSGGTSHRWELLHSRLLGFILPLTHASKRASNASSARGSSALTKEIWVQRQKLREAWRNGWGRALALCKWVLGPRCCRAPLLSCLIEYPMESLLQRSDSEQTEFTQSHVASNGDQTTRWIKMLCDTDTHTQTHTQQAAVVSQKDLLFGQGMWGLLWG